MCFKTAFCSASVELLCGVHRCLSLFTKVNCIKVLVNFRWVRNKNSTLLRPVFLSQNFEKNHILVQFSRKTQKVGTLCMQFNRFASNYGEKPWNSHAFRSEYFGVRSLHLAWRHITDIQSSAVLNRQFSACTHCTSGTTVKAPVAGSTPAFSFAAFALHLKFKAGRKVLVTKFHSYMECVLMAKDNDIHES